MLLNFRDVIQINVQYGQNGVSGPRAPRRVEGVKHKGQENVYCQMDLAVRVCIALVNREKSPLATKRNVQVQKTIYT